MNQTIEQLADEVRHLTARIPRLAVPSMRPVKYKTHPLPSAVRSAAMKASHARPEVKAKIGAITRARWADPVYRAQAIAGRYGTNPGVRDHWADPVWKAKQCALIAAGQARRRSCLALCKEALEKSR